MSLSNEDIAAASKALRLRKGYSQNEIALLYGVTQAQISRFESGNGSDVLAYFHFLTLLNPSTERGQGSSRARIKGTIMLDSAQYEVLESAKDILRARNTLKKAMKGAASEHGRLTLGTQGSTFVGHAYYLESFNLWTVFDDGSHETLWNTYGLGNPFEGGPRDMVCHLTVPAEGINRRVGGVYARDGRGNIIIMHRGKIGGGREGLGKSSFWERANVEAALVRDGDRVSEMAIVGRIGSKSLAQDVRAFVREVKRIKDEITGNEPSFVA